MHQPKFLKTSLAILLATFYSCSNNDNQALLKGDIKGLDTGWAYLYKTNNTSWPPKPIDSAQVINGAFSFTFSPDTVFQPRLVYLKYRSKKGRWEDMSVVDPYNKSKNKNKPDRFNDFILEPGITEFTGEIKNHKGISIKSGPQNDFRWKNKDLPFSDLSEDPAKRKKQVEQFIAKIKGAPNAWWAMYAMDNLKFQISNDELRTIINTFDEPTRRTFAGRKLQEFLDVRPGANDPRANNLLTTPEGKQVAMIDTTKKLNMLIFWASWCGPCRAEIPSLKKIAAQIKDERFRMVSISVDRVDKEWRQALRYENMPWEQLITAPGIAEKVHTQYNLNFIPQVFLIRNDRKLISKLDGFDPENEPKLIKLINDQLAANK